MIPVVGIHVEAGVSAAELAAINCASVLLGEILSEAGTPITAVTFALPASIDVEPPLEPPSMLVTSLLGEVENIEEPWPETAERLRARYLALCGSPGRLVYICTVFRHVSGARDCRTTSARRVRIRRLNLLAAEISNETGALVIDIDRVFADLGAQALETDFHLGGPVARERAAGLIATTILTTGLDDHVPFDVQQAAQLLLAARPSSHAPKTVVGQTSMVRSGRRVQTVERAAISENQAAAYVRQALAGKIPLREVLRRLARATARHGAGYPAGIVLSGLLRSLRPSTQQDG
jgi:hypothetical protein